MDPKLPPFLEVRDVPVQGKGVYTTKSISRGKAVFTCPPFSFGVGGITTENVRGSCHHCLAIVRDLKTSVVCGKCKVAGFCSKKCLKSARQLHSMECDGLAKLELLRGKLSPIIPHADGRSYWPPIQALMIARAINRRNLQGADCRNDVWLKQLARHNLPAALPKESIALIQKLVRGLVPDHVKEDEIDQMFRAVCINAADVHCPPKTAAAAFYFEFSLVNHSCYPNCYFTNDGKDISVYALQDITPNSQLGISYLNPRNRIGERGVRREEIRKSFGFDCHCDVCCKEEEVGSEYWLLDQQKQSLIAPWSRERANNIIKEGWELVHDSEGMERLQAIKKLESHIEIQRSVLDKVNVTLILTTWQLVRNYFLLPDYKKAIIHFKSLGETGVNAFFSYSTANEVADIGIVLSKCFGSLGLEKEASELVTLLLQFYPSNDMIRQAGIPASMVDGIREKYLQLSTRKATQAKPPISYILKLCAHVDPQ